MLTTECCICANSPTDLFLDEKSGQPSAGMRQFQCCRRVICPICLDKQPRLEEYCPYCQDTGSPVRTFEGASAFGLSSLLTDSSGESPTRPHTLQQKIQDPEKAEDTPDVLHFVDPANDTINLLSIRYGVPSAVLRKTNGIYADHLLAARRTIIISGEYYKGGVSLSPRPIDGEEMEIKKNKIRRFMVACKVAEYDIAVLYLDQNHYNLEAAILAYQQDEIWEREHPLKGKKPGKAPAMSQLWR